MTSSDVLDLSLFLKEAQRRLLCSAGSLTQCNVENLPSKGFELRCGSRWSLSNKLRSFVTIISRVTHQIDSRGWSTPGGNTGMGRMPGAKVLLYSSGDAAWPPLA